MELFDITPDIFKAPVYEGDMKPQLFHDKSISEENEYNLTSFSMSTHAGAHIDAPLHFVENGKSVEQMPLHNFVGRCTVALGQGPITAQWVEKNLPWNCHRLLIKCHGKGYLMNNAVSELCRFNLELIGIDSISIASEDNESAVHREFMYNEIAILEGINLDEVDPGEYFLFAAPLKISGAEASPCRAVLVRDIDEP